MCDDAMIKHVGLEQLMLILHATENISQLHCFRNNFFESTPYDLQAV